MFKAIIFDLWDTLGAKSMSVSHSLKEHFAIPHSKSFVKKYERSIQLHKWEHKEDMAKNFLSHFNIPVTQTNIAYFIKIHRESIEKPRLFDGMLPLLNALHKKYLLGVLSNTSIFDKDVPDRLGLSATVDAIVFSWEIHSLKPNKKNFDVMVRKLGVEPSECVFVDDTVENLVSAKKLGLTCIHFTSVDQLKKELKKLGLCW